MCTGARYLGSYIGDDESKRDWLIEHTATWEINLCKIRKTAGKYPQESYAAVVRSIQPEWMFLQCVTWDTGEVFAVVENIIQETFLPRLFFVNTKSLLTIVGALSIILVKKSVLGILYPLTSTKNKYLSYQRASANLIQAVTGVGAFSNANQLLVIR